MRPGQYTKTFSAIYLCHFFGGGCNDVAILPTSYRGLSGPSGPSVPKKSVPQSVPENGGVRESVPRQTHGLLPGPFTPRGPECPKSVPRVSPGVSKKCPGPSRDTLGTLDTLEPGPGRPRATLSLPRTPPFLGAHSGTLPGHLGPKGPRDRCKLVGGIEIMMSKRMVVICTALMTELREGAQKVPREGVSRILPSHVNVEEMDWAR